VKTRESPRIDALLRMHLSIGGHRPDGLHELKIRQIALLLVRLFRSLGVAVRLLRGRRSGAAGATTAATRIATTAAAATAATMMMVTMAATTAAFATAARGRGSGLTATGWGRRWGSGFAAAAAAAGFAAALATTARTTAAVMVVTKGFGLTFHADEHHSHGGQTQRQSNDISLHHRFLQNMDQKIGRVTSCPKCAIDEPGKSRHRDAAINRRPMRVRLSAQVRENGCSPTRGTHDTLLSSQTSHNPRSLESLGFEMSHI
jgi:hypothetical protein